MGKILDRFGVCASTLCLIHCLATPIVIFFFPHMTGIFSEHTHELFAIVVISVVAIAVLPHCNKHGHKDIVLIALTGTSLIVAAIVLEGTLPLVLHYGLTMVGSAFLIWAHLKNIKVRHGNCSHE